MLPSYPFRIIVSMSIIPNASVSHNVPVMKQPQTQACWYTSFQMVVAYQRRRNRGGELKDPSEVKWIKDIYAANNGIGATIDEREEVVRALGFRVLNASMSAEGILGDSPGCPDNLCWTLARPIFRTLRSFGRDLRKKACH